MIVKLALLFLCGMAVLGMIFGRRGSKPRRDKAIARAVRCPDCGAWIVEGARCPCTSDKG